MQRIPVKDNTLGTIIYMWPVDAEEATRYDTTGTRYTPQVAPAQIPPRKNPGGKGH